ncbi:MAG: class I SAM-dependent methyltransferase [Bacillota bacterium]|nr:class I SAM-dependent methyltransferase [Bacillota bacterium]
MEADKAYLEAIQHGRYSEKVKGLRCKYDHVRIQFEDFITAYYLRPYLEDIVERKSNLNGGEGLRFYDLGCGTGDGYELLSKMAGETKLSEFDTRLIQDEMVEQYKGIDLNVALLKEARNLLGHYDHVDFCKGNFSDGLPLEDGEDSYDLYFTSYGTLSHCNNEELERLFIDIAKHAHNRSLILGDFIGRYSYEWQELWTNDPEEQPFIDYKINYLYAEEDRDKVEVSSFPLLLMTPNELNSILESAAEKAGVKLSVLKYFDRSLFVGRHIETGTYNGNAQPLRLMVSSLFERGLRTYFPDLKVSYKPKAGFDQQNQAFQALAQSWNALVDYTMFLMEHRDSDEELLPYPPQTEVKPLERAYRVMRQTLEGSKGLFGDIRADLVEAQLGYALRSLEMSMQNGTGLGHGLVAVIRVNK